MIWSEKGLTGGEIGIEIPTKREHEYERRNSCIFCSDSDGFIPRPLYGGAPADYSEGGKLESVVRDIFTKMAFANKLLSLHQEQSK